MPWKLILVPHDFSSSANHATAIARDLAKVHGAALIVLHVLDGTVQLDPEGVVITDEGVPANAADLQLATAQAHVDDLAARLEKDGVRARGVVRTGEAEAEILGCAAEMSAAVIVMGLHGHTGLRALVAGKVTEKVVRQSIVPVLTVRHPS
ncbi:MAG TPA: universal stress protein [Kofleriaceae bacterium]|jgi:nucleotide-binding universal stress UspA family protein